MRLSKLANQPKEPLPPVVQPTAAHQALVDFFQEMLTFFAGSDHPFVVLARALREQISRDLAEVDEAQIREKCAWLADNLATVATAGLDPSQVMERTEETAE